MVQRIDAELVALARCGDKVAFSHLIERHQFVVLRLARSLVGIDIAQDLMQEAFLQAYLSLGRLRDVDRVQSWLCGIVLNVCHSYLRHQKVAYFSLEELTGGLQVDINPLMASFPDPMRIAEEQELYGLVLEAVNTLSPKNRIATQLFYFEQLTLQKIAALLGISITAVKGHLHKARGQLRKQLLSLYVEANLIDLRSYPMIKVTIADVIPSEKYNPRSYIVVLWDKAGRRFLPIWVGIWSGEVIAQILNQTSLPRPMTFEFIANLLATAAVELESVRIEAIREITYYAITSLRCGQQVREVDARPSDAIALALHMNKPIYVAQGVMEQQGIAVPPEIDSPLVGKGLAYFKGKQEEKRKEAEELEQECRARLLHPEEEVAREHTKQHQKLIAFLFGSEPS